MTSYPMAKSGKPGTALSIGVFASLIGGTVSALALFFLAPQLSKGLLIFGNWEYFRRGPGGSGCGHHHGV